MTLRILVADDHRIVRQGLSALIDKQPGMEVAGTAVLDTGFLDSRKETSDAARFYVEPCTAMTFVPVLLLSVMRLTGLACR